MKVFLSHSSSDKPAEEALARHLRQEGIDTWLDKWDIAPGDDIIAKMNEGLGQADAGVIVFAAQSLHSPWVKAEVSSLTHERIKTGQPLIPVQVGNDAYIPPLLRPLCRLSIDDHAAIADAVLHRRPSPPPPWRASGPRRGTGGAAAIYGCWSFSMPCSARGRCGCRRPPSGCARPWRPRAWSSPGLRRGWRSGCGKRWPWGCGMCCWRKRWKPPRWGRRWSGLVPSRWLCETPTVKPG